MSVIGSNLLAGASGQAGKAGYKIERSLRFNSSDSAYLSRTSSSAGNRKTWTWSSWVKLWDYTTQSRLFSSNGINSFGWDTTGILRFSVAGAGHFQSTAIYRDPSAWYHLVVSCDTTKTTDFLIFYINGVESFRTNANFSQNTDTAINNTAQHLIGANSASNLFSSFYLADVHFIDGQALDPTDFGEYDDNNVWQPKAYSGTYGTNGFHLDFSDNTSTTTIAEDSSGNNNDWTANNLSVASGAGNDSLVDSPTNGTQTDTGAGGEVVGNYATLNPLSAGTNAVLANGNLEWSTTSTSNFLAQSTIAMPSGKWYCEYTATSINNMVGIQRVDGAVATTFVGGNADSWGYYGGTGNKYNSNSFTSYGATYTTNDVIGIALDVDAGTLTFYKNGTSQGQAYSGLTSGPYTFITGNGANVSGLFNFGQRAFAYTAPSGFKALCTTNLPDPTIADGSTAMDALLFTGNGGSQTLSGLGFSPDFTWFKARSFGFSHELLDIVRGGTKISFSDLTNAESTNSSLVTSFNSDGVSIGSALGANGSSRSSVLWAWDGGTSNATNTDGSITSTVRANASAGFSIVTYTGTGANATVGHGLGASPAMYITKNRTNGTWNWNVYHSSLPNASYAIRLDRTDAQVSVASLWNSTPPTSSVFHLGSAAQTNNSSNYYVAYCFAPVDGYSSFGSYTGNGSTDGPFVYTGFRPRWVLTKASSSTSNWTVHDTLRPDYNVGGSALLPNLSDSEKLFGYMDICSNGFKLRLSAGDFNQNGVTYIYAAFAENPFKYSRAR